MAGLLPLWDVAMRDTHMPLSRQVLSSKDKARMVAENKAAEAEAAKKREVGRSVLFAWRQQRCGAT